MLCRKQTSFREMSLYFMLIFFFLNEETGFVSRFKAKIPEQGYPTPRGC